MLTVSLVAAPACGPDVDLSKTLQITDVFSGWYDDGVGAGGANHMLPSVSFRIKNNGAAPINRVQLSIAFWREGDDAPKDEAFLQGIGPTELAPGATTAPILARAKVGYNLEAARADLFTQKPNNAGSPGFTDFTAKMFAQRSGHLYRLGEFKIDRVILPHGK